MTPPNPTSLFSFLCILAAVRCVGEKSTFLDCADAGESGTCTLHVRGTQGNIRRDLNVYPGHANTLFVMSRRPEADSSAPDFDSQFQVEAFDVNGLVGADTPTRDFGECQNCFDTSECYFKAFNMNIFNYGSGLDSPQVGVILCDVDVEKIYRFYNNADQEGPTVTESCPEAKLEFQVIPGAGENSGHLALGFVSNCDGNFVLVRGQHGSLPIESAICKGPEIEVRSNMDMLRKIGADEIRAVEFSRIGCVDPGNNNYDHFVVTVYQQGNPEPEEERRERRGLLRRRRVRV